VDLRSLQRHWHAWGRRDPLWAAVTLAGKEDGRWDEDEFLRSGESEIEDVLARLAALGADVRRGRALDFGCGAGRHTQALARRFARADGVDIAASMLEVARRLGREPGCHYHHNDRPDLSLFTSATFDFVWSILALQHMRPDYAAAYVRELMRVTAPGGALVFQVPTDSPAAGGQGEGPRSVGGAPLPPGAWRARLTPGRTELALTAGDIASVLVHVENASSGVWPALGGSQGAGRVMLGARWITAAGAPLEGNEPRAALPADCAPGQAANLVLWFTVPERGGGYTLELDMVQEHVAWFQEKGSRPVPVRCAVDGPRVPVTPPAASGAGAFAGFAARHPTAHGLLRRLGVVPAYRRLARAAAAFRAARRSRRRPVMEMYGLAGDEVRRLIAEGGGRLLAVESEPWPRGSLSCQYWVAKPVDVGGGHGHERPLPAAVASGAARS